MRESNRGAYAHTHTHTHTHTHAKMSRRNDDDAAPAAAAMAAISTMSTDAAAGIGVDRSARARWAKNGRLTLYQEAKEKQGYSDPRKTKLKNDRRAPGLSADILLEKRFQDAKDDLMMTRMLAAFARSQEETHAQGRHLWTRSAPSEAYW